MNTGLTNLNVNALYKKDGKIFAGLNGGTGIAYSTNSGGVWTDAAVSNSTAFNAFVSTDTTTDMAMFAGTDNGVYRSTDMGTEWATRWTTGWAATSGSFNQKVTSLYVTKESFNYILYAGTEGNGLLRSTDFGNSFISYAISGTQTINAIAPFSIGFFAAVAGQGVYITTNGGSSWSMNSGLTNLNVHSLVVVSDNIKYAGTENCKVFCKDGSWGGGTWTEISNGLTGTSTVKALIYDGTYLYAGTSGDGVFVALATDAALPLPVELTSLSAIIKGNSIQLKWSTSTEVNNYGFEVERSKASDVWEKIGFIPGTGNSNSVRNFEFTDQNLSNGKYTYRLKQIDNDGVYEYSKEVEVLINNPEEYSLAQNFPNPFNPTTKIRYSIAKAEIVKIKVYDILGREIKVLVDEYKDPGTYDVEFNAGDLTNGLYFYNLTSDSYAEVRKMMLIK